MEYAFDEFWPTLGSLPKDPTVLDSKVQYACALIAELTYYHVPEFEIDSKKRAMVLPCLGWQDIHRSRRITNLEIFLNSTDFEGRYFIVVERNVIAVGLSVPPHLFIGFRGTKFGFDWRINLASRLTTGIYPYDGRVHRGFALEAFRVSNKIQERVDSMHLYGNVEHTFLTGHSLGGAIAALSQEYLNLPGEEHVILFGSPRYCDFANYLHMSDRVPLQIRRKGDMVPAVPPLARGYCDHPNQIDSHGQPVVDSYDHEGWASMTLKWASFARKVVAPHAMDGYRKDIGRTANAQGAELPLVPYHKLRRGDLT